MLDSYRHLIRIRSTGFLLIIASFLALLLPLCAEAAPCDTPANAIVAENCLAGNPASEWDISGSGDASIQGFATDISVDQGQMVQFKINTNSTNYRLDIYRIGYYNGAGARKVATVQPSATLPQNQPACATDSSTGLVDCGTWSVSASWTVPANATSGIYFAKLVREDPEDGRANHVIFIVRDDNGLSDVLFQTGDTTWQAYNSYGGNSFYSGSPAGRAYKVSYNRPFNSRAGTPEDWVFNADYPMVRWLEANGYNVSYFTGVDSDRFGAEILEHKVFLSVGHDEYWSGAQRVNVEAARNSGVHLAFFSGNEVFWKTRWENSIDGSSTPFRTLVSYKETHANAKIDPLANTWTGTWRDPRAFNPEGPKPENGLTGTIFTVNCCTYSIEVPAAEGKMRLWRNTSVANLSPGQKATLSANSLGYEWDEDLDNGSRPPGLFRLSSTTVNVPQRILDHGSNYGPGTATHSLTLYRDANTTSATDDALVFGAGTVQWAWGLDGNHDRGSSTPDVRMQQATVNLLADMDVQPGNIQTGLTAATTSTDSTAPTAAITSPTNGATVNGTVQITGTAVDSGGGVVGGVEVSVDNGATWRRADGRENWTYNWTPTVQGPASLRTRAVDDSGNLGAASAATSVTVGAQSCPCTIWSPSITANDGNDASPNELGVKFRSDVDGFITGIRFYKVAANTGTHIGRLWTTSGTQLAQVTFTGESASGWQEATFSSPVAVTANTTYVASYAAPNGHYAFTANYFGSSGTDNPPLHALQNGIDGGNGVFGSPGFYPTQTFNSANYWVDVVFNTSSAPDTTPPTVNSTVPAGGASGVNTGANITATFSEAMDSATINSGTFELRDASNNLVAGAVTYNAGNRTATFNPNASLANSTTYTATITTGAEDAAGNALENNFTWSFITAAPPPPPPDEGPGGPILVIGNTANPFTRYYAEILHAEGLNAFTVSDLSNVTATVLNNYDVVLLGEMTLTAAQETMFTNWVTAGGNLIAMRPDKGLASLFGLTDASATLTNAYLLVNTSVSPGAGIVNQTIQFHGTADRYTLNGATSIATLYSNATTATTNPAVTLRSVGSNGGQAAAFTFDLARSVVYTRQGNPAWSGQERDGTAPIRSDDLFFGAASGDTQPDWINLNKVAIPQADEQQRLLANLIGHVNLDKKPLPRFWYFPRGEKAVVIMTGDDHNSGGTAGRFDIYIANSPTNCSVDNWDCVRSTSYVYVPSGLTNAQADAYEAMGFEIAQHINTNCADWTPTSLESFYSTQLADFANAFPGLNPPASNRTHCIAWSDYDTQPQVAFNHGIRLDTNYYYWPDTWIQNRPGFFTGSGMPMRFATSNGTMIDVYQATTQMTDESGQTFPSFVDSLLDKAIGPEGYYGAFTANMHTDNASHAGSVAIIGSALDRNVPVVSARQMLTWLDGRNGSSFNSISWNGNALSFSVAVGAGANGLQGMVPFQSGVGTLSSITRNGNAVTFTTQPIKGVQYAFFTATTGNYVASYLSDITPPNITAVNAALGSDGTSATITWTTDESSDSRVDYGTSPGTLNLNASNATAVTSHSIPLSGLSANTTYYYRVTSRDTVGNAATSPVAANPPASFSTAAAAFTDTTVADFNAGTGTCSAIAHAGDGEVILTPTVAEEFAGASLPASWTSFAWNPGGASTVNNGLLNVDGARAATTQLYGPGRSIEFVATFGAAQFQHVGFGQDMATTSESWAFFSTFNTTNALYARTDNNGALTDTLIPGNWLGTPHRYRVDWTASSVLFYIDGNLVHSQPVSITANMRPVVSDFNTGGPNVSVDWMLMTPFAASCQYTSKVFDAGSNASWSTATWTGNEPAGTNLVLQVRTGNTASPDGTWTNFTTLSGSPGAINATSRYIQYRAQLSTTNPDQTPDLRDITLSYQDAPPEEVTISIGNATVTEGNSGTTNANFTVTLSQASSVDVSVKYATANDTATAPSDFTAVSPAATLTIPSGSTSGTITIAINGDTTPEPDESFFVNLTQPTNATIADAQATGTIDNDDTAPASAISINDVALTETSSGTTNAVFTVTVSPTSSTETKVNYATAENTAKAGLDFQTTSGTLTVPANTATGTITVPVIGDTLHENTETFNVNLTVPVNATISDGLGVASITNLKPKVTIGDISVTEGHSGTTNATFTVTSPFAYSQPCMVNYATEAVSATTPSDFTATSGTLTIPAGSTQAILAVPVVGDTTVEPAETFRVRLSNGVKCAIARFVAIGTIVNDDPAGGGGPTLTITDVSKLEGNAGTVEYAFRVQLSQARTVKTTFTYITANGTATEPADYTAKSGTGTIFANSLSTYVRIIVNTDTAVEPNETFFVNISNATGATITDAQAIGTIRNDD